jgi:uncharacterized protein YjaZ
MTNGKVEKFFKKLKSMYPIDSPVEIKVTLCDAGIVRQGRSLHGLAHKHVGSTGVDLYIDSRRDSDLIKFTLAHEYRHVMQWFNKGMSWYSTRSGKTDLEIDANLFGNMILRSGF